MTIKSKFLCALLLLSASTAHAADATGNLSVTATVAGACVVATLPVAFGLYDPTAATDNTAGNGTVTVTCTLGTPYTVALDAGANESVAGDFTTRRMLANTSDYLSYQLYKEDARTSVWGDTGTDRVTGQSGLGLPQAITVYGTIPKNQNVAAGAYLDTVLVTVSY